ncbi:MAG TPA: hypothetical protein VF341_07495 [Anaeromyxobacteraceae bacterium]
MIVFGTRGRVVKGPQKRGVPCAACGMDVHQTFGVLRYFHVFWIPMFPTLKQAGMECLHCKKALVGKELPERVRKDVAAMLFTKRRVLPTFAGAILVGLLAIPVAYGSAQQTAREAAYLETPTVGDCYVVRVAGFVKNPDSKHPYGVLRVAKVASDHLELRLGAYAYSQARGADQAISRGEILRADYFAARPITLAASDLLRLKREHTIQAVRR